MKLPDFEKCPRAVALDLDGTLLDSRGRVSERGRRAIEELAGRGIPVIFATSRPARTLKRVFPDGLADLCSLVVMNGAVAIGRPPLSGYFRDKLPEKMADTIIGLAQGFSPTVRITVELDGYTFGANWTVDPETLWERNAATPDMLLSIPEAMKMEPSKVVLGTERESLLRLREEVLAATDGAALVLPTLFGPPILNITTPQATKPEGIRRLLEPAGMGMDEVIAFGDDLPDLGMLQACGMAVAMGNACDEVKSACEFVTAGNDEDGVALVLERLLEL